MKNLGLYTMIGLLTLCGICSLSACTTPSDKPIIQAPQQQSDSMASNAYKISYQLDDPNQVIKLPGRLEEISGLSFSADNNYLLAIQDEDGKVFWIDKKSGEVTKELKFWKDGDYEGVEFTPQGIFVVKSTGTLYQIKMNGTDVPDVTKYNTLLGSTNDVEGLAYDSQKKELLLACKAAAGEGEEFAMTKAIYRFDLKKMELDIRPKYIIKLDDVNNYLKTDPLIRKLEKLNAFFAPGESTFGFSPSAIAIHPKTREMYILSSVGKILMILDRDGTIKHIEKLKKSIHEQPEGICFDKNGHLFISNEGKGGKGTIYRFNFLP